MKKIISSLFIVSLLFTSCKNDEKTNKTVIDKEISTIVGIGKVVPSDGLINLNVDSSQKVTKILKKIGDTVYVGDTLFEMESITEQLQVEQSNEKYISALENVKVKDYEINQAELKLIELKNNYKISKSLAAKNAETKENVFKDSVAYLQQQQIVNQLKQSKKALLQSTKQDAVQVKASQISLKAQQFTAVQNGILKEFNVSVGDILQPNTSFGELASISELIVQAEMDEYYAHEIKVGQQVDINLVGQTNAIAKGIVSFVGLGLQNKSIMYETIGEGNDRRVRRFDVKITEGLDRLLINQKVECKIIK